MRWKYGVVFLGWMLIASVASAERGGWPVDYDVDQDGQQCNWGKNGGINRCFTIQAPEWTQDEIILTITQQTSEEISWTYICLPEQLDFGSWDQDGGLDDGGWDNRVGYYEPGYDGSAGRVEISGSTTSSRSFRWFTSMASVAFIEINRSYQLVEDPDAPFPVRQVTEQEWTCPSDNPALFPTTLESESSTSRVYLLQYIPATLIPQ